MTVAELIAHLQQLPQDHLVVRSGYEGGVAAVTGVDAVMLTLHVNTAWYYGPHEITEDGTVPAVYIS